MAVYICGKRYRGSWPGVFSMSFVLFSWTYISYCSMFILIKHFMEGIYQEVAFYGYATLSILSILSIFEVIMSDPGKVYAVSNAGGLGWGRCDKCDKYRPPRSHHCSRCGKCVRKLDHHCIWINNCVGEDNHGLFIRFLSYSWLQTSVSAVVCLTYYMNWFPPCATCIDLNSQDGYLKIKVIFLFLDVLWFIVFLSGLMVHKLILLAADMTTIETFDSGGLLRARVFDIRNPGFIKHLSVAFGTTNMLLWFVPCCCGSRIVPEYESPVESPWMYNV